MVDVTEFGVRNVEEAVKQLRSRLSDGWTEREISLAEAVAAGVKDELDRREAKVLAELEGLRKDLDDARGRVKALRKALDDSLGQVKSLLKALPAPQVQVKNIVPEAPPAPVHVQNVLPEQAPPQVSVTVPPPRLTTKTFRYDDYGRPAQVDEQEKA